MKNKGSEAKTAECARPAFAKMNMTKLRLGHYPVHGVAKEVDDDSTSVP